ncbi:threonine ammonia-lyase, partial [Bacillus thuringiensis]
MSNEILPLNIGNIKKAQKILDGNARKTPLVKSFYLTSKTGGEIYLKLENMQLTG